MSASWFETTADVVRDAIARCMLGADVVTSRMIPERHGSIQLRPHQLDAVVRLQRLMDECGGALLADEVGLGKTYVALALARDAQRLMIVAPAALRPMWEAALERVRRRATLVSFERLSRAGDQAAALATSDPDLVIVDESHHVRTPTTRRYAALARICKRSRVLLLSATPLQNSRRDLAAQLALFLGAAVRTMSDAELTRYAVRRTRKDLPPDMLTAPTAAAPVWVELPRPDDCLDALLALPPPVPPSDGGDGGALLVYSVVRRWASSRAALQATLRRRLARAAALTAVLETGRYPSTVEIAAWSYADATVQLAFPELIAASGVRPAAGSEPADVGDLLSSVQVHEAAVRDILRLLDTTPDPDLDRAAALRAIRSDHPGEHIVAFAESVETVQALFRKLRSQPGVAMLGARGAAVSGGTLSRCEALARFAPVAQRTRPPHPSQRIDLLLATDVLSEGVNLQDASVVVHLDLPWNPARLEQRVGRVSRLGSPHELVSVYALRPPAAAERLLAVERRLRAKLAAAGRSLGVIGTILPGLGIDSSVERGTAEDWTRINATLRAWSTRERRTVAVGSPRVAAVRSAVNGFVAAVMSTNGPTLIASLREAEPSIEPRDLVAAIELAGGTNVAIDSRAMTQAATAIDRWLSRRAASQLSGIDVAAVARARRRVLARIGRVAARAPRQQRSAVSTLVADARRAALMPLSEGAERVLAELAEASLADGAWLRTIVAFGELHAHGGRTSSTSSEVEQVVALLLLQSGPGQPSAP